MHNSASTLPSREGSTLPSPELPPVVLIVEADADNRDLFETALRTSGMWASSVEDVDEAFTYADDIRPDAVLADLELGRAGDALALAERLRSNERTARIPIVAVTGRAPQDVEARPGLLDVLLQKPVVLPAMVERLREVISTSAELRERALRVRAKVPGLIERSGHLLERSLTLTSEAGRGAATSFPRPCPQCSAELRWIERRQLMGVVFDYYAPCPSGCGLFCYDHARHAFVTLIG